MAIDSQSVADNHNQWQTTHNQWQSTHNQWQSTYNQWQSISGNQLTINGRQPQSMAINSQSVAINSQSMAIGHNQWQSTHNQWQSTHNQWQSTCGAELIRLDPALRSSCKFRFCKVFSISQSTIRFSFGVPNTAHRTHCQASSSANHRISCTFSTDKFKPELLIQL